MRYNIICYPRSGSKLLQKTFHALLEERNLNPYKIFLRSGAVGCPHLGEFLHFRTDSALAFEDTSTFPFQHGKKIWSLTFNGPNAPFPYCFFSTELDDDRFYYVKSQVNYLPLTLAQLSERVDIMLSLPRAWINKTFPVQLYAKDLVEAPTSLIDELLVKIDRQSTSVILTRNWPQQVCSNYMMKLSNLSVPSPDQASFVEQAQLPIRVPWKHIEMMQRHARQFNDIVSKLYPNALKVSLENFLVAPTQELDKLGFDLTSSERSKIDNIRGTSREFSQYIDYSHFIENYNEILSAEKQL